jgi:cobalt-zinc-cadmium efflux system protein
VIAFTGAAWVDPIISVLIAIVIAFGALGVIRETLNILLEATPKGVETTRLADDMRRVNGVRTVHDLHVWTITSGVLAMSSHVVIDDVPPSVSAPILDRLVEMLRQRYNISHTTIQFESAAHPGHEGFCACQPSTCDGKLFCELSPADDADDHADDHAGGRRTPVDTHHHVAHA